MGFFSKEKNLIPEIGSEIPWTQIIEEVFKVKDFDRNGTVINENGKVVRRLERGREKSGKKLFMEIIWRYLLKSR